MGAELDGLNIESMKNDQAGFVSNFSSIALMIGILRYTESVYLNIPHPSNIR